MKDKMAVKIEEIIAPVIASLGLELVDINFVKEGGRWFLRIFIDQPGGIGLEECQMVSEKISPLLDEKDPIAQAYILEVSSPGLDRPLKKLADFQRFCGREINLKSYEPIGGRRRFKGELVAATDQAVTLKVDDENVVVPIDRIASARLVPEIKF